MNSKMIFKIALIVGVCIIAFFLSRYFFGGQSDQIGLITTTGSDGQILAEQRVNDVEAKQYLDLLASVRGVSDRIREQFVNNSVFSSLEDYTVTITPKTISRSNPFLPVGMGGTYVNVSSNSINSDNADNSSTSPSDFIGNGNVWGDSEGTTTSTTATNTTATLYKLNKTKAKASVIDSIRSRSGR